MSNVYESPSSNLETIIENKVINRPRVVTVIAIIFLLMALIDFVLSVRLGLAYETYSFDENGNAISNGYKVELLWLIFYGIGAGLMRGGKFARFMACLFGTLALVFPGIVLIYYLYNTKAKEYFSIKLCDRCGDTSYINNSYTFNGVSCRKCSKTLDFESA